MDAGDDHVGYAETGDEHGGKRDDGHGVDDVIDGAGNAVDHFFGGGGGHAEAVDAGADFGQPRRRRAPALLMLIMRALPPVM